MLRASLLACLALQLLALCARAADHTAHAAGQPAHEVVAESSRQLQSAGGGGEPLNIGFYLEDGPARSAEDAKYIATKLLPAAINTLQRSVRLRHAAGPMDFSGRVDVDGKPIEQPPPGVNFWIKVPDTSECAHWPSTVIAGGYHSLVNKDGGRPTFAYLVICQLSDWDRDLETVTHELIHMLAMHPDLMTDFAGGDATPVTLKNGLRYMTSPQVTQSARRQLGCARLPGAPMEDDLGGGMHFDQRAFEGDLMDTQSAATHGHSSEHPLTDMTLGLLQDSGWYDVKYGSAGFNPFGYKAGCPFALGRYRKALAMGRANRYLCGQKKAGKELCLHDATGSGQCQTEASWDGFYAVYSNASVGADLDCTDTAGHRCIQRRGKAPGCARMACGGPKGTTLLINGKECDNSKFKCPRPWLFCGDPGLLTCAGERDDCSGHGDCGKGHCYCHLGWGGAACDVPVCTGSCPDGSACPPSGFCGVPECGEWSSGADDRGTSCGPL